jgi:hypothetical protein
MERMIKFSAAIFLGLSATCILHAQTNSRFDGTWIGNETVRKVPVSYDEKPSPPRSIKTTIIIQQGGTLVGVIGGLCPGRFSEVEVKGKTLNLKAGDCSISLNLSPDSKTLTEHGMAQHYSTGVTGMTMSPYLAYRYQIAGTFRRQ